MDLAYRHWGIKNNSLSNAQTHPTLVLLHGMGGTGSLWRPIAAHLEEEFQVIAPDQRGHGGSRPVPDSSFTPEAYGQDVAHLLDQLQIPSAWVVGHSMGVRTACALAHLRPDLVRGLVLVDLGLSGPAGGGLGAPLAEFLRDMPLHFPSRTAARAHMEAHCPDASIGQYLMAVSVPAPGGAGEITFPFDRDALLSTLQAAETSRIRDWIPGILAHHIPILVLRGETSQVWSASDYAEEKSRWSSNPLIQFETFAGAGHGLPFEKRVQFLERLRTFMNWPRQL